MLLRHALRSLPRQLLTTSCEQILLGSERDLFPSAGLLVVHPPSRRRRSGHNIISKINNSVAREICKIRKSFLPQRIRNYWNNLPLYVKMSENVFDFKINLEKFKSQSVNIHFIIFQI